MTTAVSVSPGEIRRVGVWALRAVGYKFGTAERGATLLACAEATGAAALRLLRDAGDRIAASAAAPTRRARTAPGGWVIEAQGKCLLEVGPPAVDLVTSVAEATGAGAVIVRDTFGVGLVGALCGLAVDRGLDVLAVFDAGARDDEPLPLGQQGWLSATASGFRSGPITPDRFDALRRLAVPLGIDVADVVPSSARPSGCFAIFATRRGDAATVLPDIGAPAFADAGAVRWHDHAGQIRRADAVGIAVPFEDFLNLYALERRCWAPTSEKSRNQAAF